MKRSQFTDDLRQFQDADHRAVRLMCLRVGRGFNDDATVVSRSGAGRPDPATESSRVLTVPARRDAAGRTSTNVPLTSSASIEPFPPKRCLPCLAGPQSWLATATHSRRVRTVSLSMCVRSR
jgi:hypothetical protein